MIRNIINGVLAATMLVSVSVSSANAVTWNSDHGVITELTQDHKEFINKYFTSVDSGVLGGFFWTRVNDDIVSVPFQALKDAGNTEKAIKVVERVVTEYVYETIIETNDDVINRLQSELSTAISAGNMKDAQIANLRIQVAEAESDLVRQFQRGVNEGIAGAQTAYQSRIVTLNDQITDLRAQLAAIPTSTAVDIPSPTELTNIFRNDARYANSRNYAGRQTQTSTVAGERTINIYGVRLHDRITNGNILSINYSLYDTLAPHVRTIIANALEDAFIDGYELGYKEGFADGVEFANNQ